MTTSSTGRPRLTRRGRVVVGVAVLGAALGWWYGGRSLNAVVVPAVALLVAGLASIGRTVELEIDRHTPRHGFVGDDLRVELAVHGNHPWTARVVDAVPEALDADAAFETIVDGRTLAYDLRLATRGVHDVGPLTVSLQDLFGLWERTLTHGDVDEVVAFPPIHPLHESADLLAGYVGLTSEREQFDAIREYEQGDALRDVNWKASAKRAGDLVVTQWSGEGAMSTVTIAAEAPRHRADSVAEATASVAAHLLDNGLSVGLVTPREQVTPGQGEPHRRALLTTLARFREGRLGPADSEAADVVVRAPRNGRHVRIEVEDASHRFGEFVGGRAEGVTA